MTGERPSTPIRIEGHGKLRNGLFLRGIALYDDRIEFEVYASRPFRAHELTALSLADNTGTEYEMVPLAVSVVEGRASIEFQPAPPKGWMQLHLGEAGWALHILNKPE